MEIEQRGRDREMDEGVLPTAGVNEVTLLPSFASTNSAEHTLTQLPVFLPSRDARIRFLYQFQQTLEDNNIRTFGMFNRCQLFLLNWPLNTHKTK